MKSERQENENPAQNANGPRTSGEFVDLLVHRRKRRHLDKIDDRTYALELQKAGVVVNDPLVTEMGEALEKHLLDGKNADDFLDEHEEFNSLSLSHLAGVSFDIRPTVSLSEPEQMTSSQEDKRLTTTNVDTGVFNINKYTTELTPKQKEQINDFLRTYPIVKNILTEDEGWIKSGGERYYSRSDLYKFFAGKDEQPLKLSSSRQANHRFISLWEKDHNTSLGRKLPARGGRRFVNSSELVSYLFFIHELNTDPDRRFAIGITKEPEFQEYNPSSEKVVKKEIIEKPKEVLGDLYDNLAVRELLENETYWEEFGDRKMISNAKIATLLLKGDGEELENDRGIKKVEVLWVRYCPEGAPFGNRSIIDESKWMVDTDTFVRFVKYIHQSLENNDLQSKSSMIMRTEAEQGVDFKKKDEILISL